jgi:UDP-glucose 4-epimerase
LSDSPLVVFGAAGFIGGVLARRLEERGFRVIRITSRDADFSDREQLLRLQSNLPARACWILTAARSPDYPGDASENAQADLRATDNLCALAHLCPPSGMVFLSSIDVYGRAGLALPLNESSPLRPETPYAEMKAEAERRFSETAEALDVPLLTLRLPGVYGPGDSHRGPVSSFIDAARAVRSIVIHGNGEQRRDLLYVDDLPELVSRWLRAPQTLLSNAAPGEGVSLNAMVSLLRQCSGLPLTVEYRPTDVRIDILFDTPRLVSVYPSLRLTPLRDGLATTWRAVSQGEGV